jgi:hypothetical protein
MASILTPSVARSHRRHIGASPICSDACARRYGWLDDDLLRQAKALAARTGRTLTDVIEDGLREALARRRGRQERAPVALPTFKGKGLRHGVDLDDTAALLDTVEGRL